MRGIVVIAGWLIMAGIACGRPEIPAAPDIPAATMTPAPAESWQAWQLTRGEAKEDQAWGVDTDARGDVYAAAYMQVPPDDFFFDVVVYKFTPEGDELWRTQWGGQLQEKAFVVTVSEPLVLVGGLVNTAVDPKEADMLLLALDMDTGDVLWSFTWGQGFGYEEVDGLVADGEAIYLSGWTTGETTGGDMAVLKLDRRGRLLWANNWGTAGFDSADGQMVVDEEYIHVSGRVDGNGILLGGDAALVRFSKESGDYVSHVTWGGAAFDDGLGLAGDGEHLYVVGLTSSYPGGGQIFLLRYDRQLRLVWEQLWGGARGESARAVEVAEDGDILIAGSTGSHGAGGDDIVLLRYSPEGELRWWGVWGGPEQDVLHGMAIAGEAVYLVGNTDSSGRGQADALIIRAGLPPAR